MKTKIKIFAAIAALAVTGIAQADVASVARSISYNTGDLVRLSQYLGDYGAPYFDLADFNRNAANFAYTLNFSDYLRLRDSYLHSRQTWGYLRSYQQEPNKFAWLDNDMRDLGMMMNPGPQPVFYSLRAVGSGGTTVGDKPAACERARERAQAEVYGQCSNYHGAITTQSFSGCGCRHMGGQKWNCDVTAFATCRVN